MKKFPDLQSSQWKESLSYIQVCHRKGVSLSNDGQCIWCSIIVPPESMWDGRIDGDEECSRYNGNISKKG